MQVLGSLHPCLFSQMWGEAWWVTRGRARSPGGRSGPGCSPLLRRCPPCSPQAPGCSPQVARVQLAASVFPGQAGLLTRPLCFRTSAPDHSASHHQTWGSADFGTWGLIPACPGLCSAASSTGAHGESTPTPRRGPSLARSSTTVTSPRAPGRPLGMVTTASRDANFPQEQTLLWRPPPETDLSEAPAPLRPCPRGRQLPLCPRA